MPGVCCGCVAKPASVSPRKTYNTLVAALFIGEPIKTTDALDTSLRRKIQKIQEYVQKNPAKIPKVSRRLMRRIHQTLRKPGDNLGEVKVAVYAYIYMLAKSAEEDSSYSPSFFSKELLPDSNAVIPLLLRDPHLEMRTLGAELLCAFTAVQSDADTKLEAIQEMTPLTCRAARAALHAEDADQKVFQAQARRKKGDVLAVPNPLDLIARRNPARVAALESSCLRCLCEVVSLAARNKVAPDHLEEMQAVALENIRRPAGELSAAGSDAGDESLAGGSIPPAGPATGTAASTCGATAPRSVGGASAAATAATGAGGGPPAGVVDREFNAAMGISERLPTGGATRDLAGRLLQLLTGFVRDIATVYEVMGKFFDYMDTKQRWGEGGIVQAFMSALASSGTPHNFPIYSSILRHAPSRALSPSDACAVVDLAAQQARRLDAAYAMPALAAALQKLPAVWAAQARAAGGGGAAADASAPLVLEALGTGAGASAGEGGLGTAQLRVAIVELVRHLAGGVSSAGELAEALASALRGLPSDCAGDAAAAAMAAECADQAAASWAAAHQQQQQQQQQAADAQLPGGTLPPPLVNAVLEAHAAVPAPAGWPLLRLLARLLPSAPEGLRTDKQAAALVGAVCRSLFSEDPASWAAAAPADAAQARAILASCLPPSGPPRPAARLTASRWLLHAARGWATAGGYAGAGGGDAARALAVLRAADATASRAAGPGAVPPPPLAAAVSAPAGGEAAALAELAQRQIPADWAGAARALFVASPELLEEYGAEQLPVLLDQPPEADARAAGEGDCKQPFADRVNAMLAKRMMTLRRDLAHASELMRDSLVPRPSDAGALSAGPDAMAIAAASSSGAFARAAGAARPGESLPLDSLDSLPSIPEPSVTSPDPSFAPEGLLPPATSWIGPPPPAQPAAGAAANGAGGGAPLDQAGLAKVLSSGLPAANGGAASGGGALLAVEDVRISALAGELEPGWR